MYNNNNLIFQFDNLSISESVSNSDSNAVSNFSDSSDSLNNVNQMQEQRVIFKKLYPNILLPQETQFQNVFDLVTITNTILKPHKTTVLDTGLVLCHPKINFTIRQPTYGLSKAGLVIYGGKLYSQTNENKELKILAYNSSFQNIRINNGEIIASVVLECNQKNVVWKVLFCN